MSTSLKEAEGVMSEDICLPDAAEPYATKATRPPHRRLRLLVLMAQGPGAALTEAWRSYAQIEDARASALAAMRNPEVLRVAIIEDGASLVGSVNPLRFVEWVG